MKTSRIVSVLMAVLMTAGCASTGAVATVSGSAGKLAVGLQFSLPNYFFNDAAAETEWETYMSDRYGNTVDGSSISFADASAGVSNGTVSGLVDLSQGGLVTAINEGTILPLEDYLNNNKAWLSLPETYRNYFMKDGHIWAIPSTISKEITVTSFRTDWLAKAGKSLPTNTVEVLEAGKAFLASDANGDGDKTDDYLTGSIFGLCPDLLNSFGLYANIYNRLMINYDPTEDCVVDALFKPEAKDALTFVRDCYASGLLNLDKYSTGDTSGMNKGVYGSYTGELGTDDMMGLNWYMKNDSRYKSMDEVEAYQNKKLSGLGSELYQDLPPLSSENPVAVYTNSSGYVLTKDTKDPQAVASEFVDLLFGSMKSYLDCTLGVPEHYTVGSDKVICMNYKDKNTKSSYAIPKLVDYNTVIPEADYLVAYSKETKDIEAKIMKDYNGKRDAYLEKYEKTGQVVEISPFLSVQSSTLDTNITFIQREYYKLMIGLLKPDADIDQLLKDYRDTVRDLCHMQQILDEANKAIGKTSKQVIS